MKIKINLLLLFNIFSIYSKTLNFHEYFIDLFPQEAVPTEWNAYKLLKKDPIKKDINYLAVPWVTLINKNQLNKIPNIKLNGGFTICQHINYEKIIPILLKIGIDVLFTPHVNKTYKNIKVLPFAHVAINGILPSIKKDIFYSFIGLEKTHWTRKEIFNMTHAKNTFILKRDDWHFWINKYNTSQLKLRQIKEKIEYQHILSRSKFSLCPRGTGTSTIRFWESLQAGAIPILISDDFKFPKGFQWEKCVIQIKEKNVKQIPEILSLINHNKYKYMSKECQKASKLFSGKNLVKIIRDYYD